MKNIRKLLLLYEVLTDYRENNKIQQIMSQKWNKPQHILYMKQPSIHEEIIITVSILRQKTHSYIK